METELKLLIDPKHVAKLRRNRLLKQYAAEKPHQQELVSIYFDTPGLRVWRLGAALRTRQVDKGWLHALKGGGTVSGGLHQRGEWEFPGDGPELDLAALCKLVGARSRWGKLLRDPQLAKHLQPIFSTQIIRTVWKLHLPAGTEIEFALDQGTVERRDTTLPISEIELELKSGDAMQLFDFALELLETVPMRIGNVSKAEHGYTLCGVQQPRVVHARMIKLSPAMTAAQGFRAIAANCMAQIEGNEAGVAEGDDPECLHQMRIGLRCLRSALDLFRGVIACPPALCEEIDWLGAQLGEARDWDVLSETSVAAVAAGISIDAGVNAVQQLVSAMAGAKREIASAAVTSVRFTRLMLKFHCWLLATADCSSAASNKANTPLRKFADQMLEQERQRLLKRGKHLRDADPSARHRLRVAVKRSRYATEFLRSLYPAKRVNRYVDVLSSLQDELGRLNDAAVADRLLHEIQQLKPNLAAAVGFIRGYVAASAQEDRKLNKLWKQCSRMKAPGCTHLV